MNRFVIKRDGEHLAFKFNNAVSFSSALTMNRFPSRCASAIQIVRPFKSIAETQPQLQLALLRLSAIFSRYFTKMRDFCLLWL